MRYNLGGDVVYSWNAGLVFDGHQLTGGRKPLVLGIIIIITLTRLNLFLFGVCCLHNPWGVQRRYRVFFGGLEGFYCRSRSIECTCRSTIRRSLNLSIRGMLCKPIFLMAIAMRSVNSGRAQRAHARTITQSCTFQCWNQIGKRTLRKIKSTR